MNYKLLNGSNLAYIGDAYYELKVRERLLSKGITKNIDLQKHSIKYVSANAHYMIFEQIKENLTEEEMKIFLRGRNNAPHGYRKNVDKGAYVVSSGFEAVVGYLYLEGNLERLNEILQMAFNVVEGGE